MKTSMKSLASLAVVGTVAVVAILGLTKNQSSNASTFLAEDNDQEVNKSTMQDLETSRQT